MSRPDRPEVAWFASLCDDDYDQLGVPDAGLRSSWPHCRDITVAADRHGYDNILLPSGYSLGIDSVAASSSSRSSPARWQRSTTCSRVG